MLVLKHLLPIVGVVSLVAADGLNPLSYSDAVDAAVTSVKEANEGKANLTWFPSYRRKTVDAHLLGNTAHHFHSYTGYEKFQQELKDQIKHQKRHHKHLLPHRKHKHIPPQQQEPAAIKEEQMEVSATRRSGSGGYTLIKDFSGSTFFDNFFFYTNEDPSGGMINYVGKEEAQRSGLVWTKDGNAFMKIGSGSGNGIQKSVRISSQMSFTTGVWILDAVHMPTGCGVWPSFWSTPKDPQGGWPNGGEIDLVEGVHYMERNMYSIHAPSWCSVNTAVDMLGKLAMPDKSLAGNCDPKLTDDQGCGVQSQSDGDYGRAYNRVGGGLHVLDWDSKRGIHAYFFPRDKIPQDIQAGDPQPWKWGTPKASWPATNCKPDDYFKSHVAVFTNTVCGTWGGSSDVWNNAMGGQKMSCKARTGKNSCYDYMKDSPNLSTAYWEIKSLKIYQTSRRE